MVRRFLIAAVATALVAPAFVPPALAQDNTRSKGPQSHFGRARLGEVAGLLRNITTVSQASTGTVTIAAILR